MIPALPCKVFLVVLGLAVVCLAGYSHFYSAWVDTEVYKICDDVANPGRFQNCPSLKLEKFFINLVLPLFLLSVVTSIVFNLCKNGEEYMKTDMLFHVVASILMLAASTCYIVSAEQIDNLTTASGIGMGFNRPQARKELLRTEKLVAGAFGILQSAVYGLTAVLLYKNWQVKCKPSKTANTNFTLPPIQNRENISKSSVLYEKF